MAVDMMLLMPLILHGSKDWMAVQQGGSTAGKDRSGRQVPILGQTCCRLCCQRIKPDLTVPWRQYCRCGSDRTRRLT